MAFLDESDVNTGMARHYYNRIKSNEHVADSIGLVSQLIIDVASHAMGTAKESELSIALAEVITLLVLQFLTFIYIKMEMVN